MIFYNILPTPLTDFTFMLCPSRHQYSRDPLCCDLEMKFMDCMEAYGVTKAREKCRELLYDLNECSRGHLQRLRAKAIQTERMRQYRAGKLSKPFEEYPALETFLFM